MRFSINHETRYDYEQVTRNSIQLLRVTPQTLAHQTVLSWRLTLPRLAEELYDGFGNYCTVLSLNEPHQQLCITAEGEVAIDDSVSKIKDDRVPAGIFLRQTTLTDCTPALYDFAAAYLSTPITPSCLEKLSAAILQRVTYTKGSTDIATTAEEAFAQQQGVCQDHAHIFIACVRAFGVPARYVSGYLHTDNDDHIASHAWAEAYFDGYWYTFDISNLQFSPSQHVQIAVGLDYNDASPIKGMRVGGGKENMKYLVQVVNQQQQQ